MTAPADAIVHVDPEILGGTPVFRGTRVPVKNPFDYLAAGDTRGRLRSQAVVVPRPARDLVTVRAG